jgi:hypothetical protein
MVGDADRDTFVARAVPSGLGGDLNQVVRPDVVPAVVHPRKNSVENSPTVGGGFHNYYGSGNHQNY